MEEYYIYFLIDPRTRKVFYIGKGKGNRIDSHFKELEKFRQMIKDGIPYGNKFKNADKLHRMLEIEGRGYEVVVHKIIENICEESAFMLEEYFIEQFGRKVTKKGTLSNIMPGGKQNSIENWWTDKGEITYEKIESHFPELLDVIDNVKLLYK